MWGGGGGGGGGGGYKRERERRRQKKRRRAKAHGDNDELGSSLTEASSATATAVTNEIYIIPLLSHSFKYNHFNIGTYCVVFPAQTRLFFPFVLFWCVHKWLVCLSDRRQTKVRILNSECISSWFNGRNSCWIKWLQKEKATQTKNEEKSKKAKGFYLCASSHFKAIYTQRSIRGMCVVGHPLLSLIKETVKGLMCLKYSNAF